MNFRSCVLMIQRCVTETDHQRNSNGTNNGIANGTSTFPAPILLTNYVMKPAPPTVNLPQAHANTHTHTYHHRHHHPAKVRNGISDKIDSFVGSWYNRGPNAMSPLQSGSGSGGESKEWFGAPDGVGSRGNVAASAALGEVVQWVSSAAAKHMSMVGKTPSSRPWIGLDYLLASQKSNRY